MIQISSSATNPSMSPLASDIEQPDLVSASTALPADKLAAIRLLCDRHGVARLELFGSAATGSFKPGVSDYDFLYELDAVHEAPQAGRLLEFADALEALLGTHVDLVNPRYIRNRYFQAEVDRTRMLIHG
jgi:predicted nucleotidyltransferase